MQTFEFIEPLKKELAQLKAENKKIGFVPTMGTLHEGHLSLVRQSKAENDITVCSIFVNPIQFNNKEDLAKYPRQLRQDLEMLQKEGCNIVFHPDEKEMYPEPATETYNFEGLENVMEGAFRPGHFNGVAVVVKRLFDIVNADVAYFGEKDFQQLAVIKMMVSQLKMPIRIVGCPIIREKDGLAMSSRNLRLTAEHKKVAPFIYSVLNSVRQQALDGKSVENIKTDVIQKFQSQPEFRLEYFEIADAAYLQPLTGLTPSVATRAFIAAWLGEIRLIDNIEIYS